MRHAPLAPAVRVQIAGGKPVVTNNHIERNRLGVEVSNDAGGEFTNNVVRNNAMNVIVQNGTHPPRNRLLLRRGSRPAAGQARMRTPYRLFAGANPSFRSCSIGFSDGVGVLVCHGGKGHFTKNTFESNLVGVEVTLRLIENPNPRAALRLASCCCA